MSAPDPSPAPAAPARGARKANAALALATVLVSLFAIELALRFVKRGVPFQPDPDLFRSLRPNIVAPIYSYETKNALEEGGRDAPTRPVLAGNNNTNNIGFRMDTDVGEKLPDERRILLLGDSFTEADQVAGDKRFSSLVDAQLREETKDAPKHERLLNGGIQNGSPAQYALQLRKWLPELHPDVVIVALAPNDVADDLIWERTYGLTFDAEGGPLAPIARGRLTAIQSSYLLRYFFVYLQQGGQERLEKVFAPIVPELPALDNGDLMCRGDARAKGYFNEKTAKYLRWMKQRSEAAGAKFAVLLIQYMWFFDDEPYSEMFAPPYKEVMKDCYASHGHVYNEFAEAFLREAGIPFQNPYEALLSAKKENPTRKLWHFVDYHYSPAGHRVIAGELHKLVASLR